MYNMYLDDERTPKTNRDWVIVRSYTEATEYVRTNGMPQYVSFDHDLGTEQTGYDFAKWLVEYDLNHQVIPEDFEFNVHSANPVGRDNIIKYLQNYLAVKHGQKR